LLIGYLSYPFSTKPISEISGTQLMESSWHADAMEGVLKHKLLGLTPEFLIQQAQARARESPFLSSSHRILVVGSGTTHVMLWDWS
jgi:hypothetical protein